MSIVVKHVSQNVLSVLQTLGHLSIAAFQGLVEWES